MKIIIHIDERKKWPMVLSNLEHLNEFYTDDSHNVIEILANGDAVSDLQKTSEQSPEIKKAIQSHNHLVACNNSLKQRAIDPLQLIDKAEIVPSGVVEIVQKQAEGYHYLRP